MGDNTSKPDTSARPRNIQKEEKHAKFRDLENDFPASIPPSKVPVGISIPVSGPPAPPPPPPEPRA